jgi:superoxide oxidase
MPQPPRYRTLSIALHWGMLALIALTYAAIELRVLWERGTPERSWLREMHFGLGLMVLGLVLVRIVARLRWPPPPITPPLRPWQRAASQAVHGLLYLFMLGMPLVGWLMLSLRGDEVMFFGLQLPPLAAEDKDLGKLLRGWHGDIGRIFYGVLGLHAAAALFHHHVLRDDTLRRMLPTR